LIIGHFFSQAFDAGSVDGDHNYRAARSDVDFALSRSARLIALHDIADSDWYGQRRCGVFSVWAELPARLSTEEPLVARWVGSGSYACKSQDHIVAIGLKITVNYHLRPLKCQGMKLAIIGSWRDGDRELG
jgi:hypothetical protein